MDDLDLNERESSKDDLTVRDDPFLHFYEMQLLKGFIVIIGFMTV